MNKYFIFIFMLSVSSLISGCVGVPPKPNYVFVHDSCDWVKPLYMTTHDIEVMDSQTKRDVLAHNIAWQNNCENQISTPDRDKSVPARGKGLR